MRPMISLAEALGQARSPGDVEFEIAQLEEQFENAATEAEREELHYKISELYNELEEA